MFQGLDSGSDSEGQNTDYNQKLRVVQVGIPVEFSRTEKQPKFLLATEFYVLFSFISQLFWSFLAHLIWQVS